jgi:hypothetical protein
MTFTGQSLKGPKGSVAFLRLANTAVDRMPTSRDSTGLHIPDIGTSAAGRAQGIALRHGKGRVVVMGEAACLTSQIDKEHPDDPPFGMSHPDIDNRQLALNILHWLSSLTR